MTSQQRLTTLLKHVLVQGGFLMYKMSEVLRYKRYEPIQTFFVFLKYL